MRCWLALTCAAGFALALAGVAAAQPDSDPCSADPGDSGTHDDPGAAEYRHDDGRGPLDCFLVADRDTFLSRAQSLTLCTGALSSGPADCFVRARRDLMISDQQAIDLCRCARTTSPVDCFVEADRETFLSLSQIVRLCGPIYAEGLLPSCRPAGGDYYPPGPPIEITP
jgi:hypothetical protein